MAESTVRHSKSFGAEHGLIHEAVVTGRKAGAGEGFWKALAHDRDLFTEVVDFVDTRVKPKTPRGVRCTPKLAAQILGKNFAGPAVIKNRLGITLEPGEYRTIPFSETTLRALAETHLLLAAPEVSIDDLRRIKPHLFSKLREDYPYTPDLNTEPFAAAELEPGWYLVRKHPALGTTNRNWAAQQTLVQYPDYIYEANLGVLAYVVHEPYEKLFHGFTGPSSYGVRTSTQDSAGRQICLQRDWERRGLMLAVDAGASSLIGAASARRPS